MYLQRHPRAAVGSLALALALGACGKKEAPAPEPEAPAAPEAAAEAAPTPSPSEPAETAVAPAEDAGSAEPAVDPRQNAWSVAPVAAKVKEGDRVYVLTKGRDRSMTDGKAVYQLFAHDVAGVEGELVHIAEIGGGKFTVAGNFVIHAGVEKASDLKVGDAVLAEWASSLKHAVVVGFEGPKDAPEKVKIRYTDLPESWPDDKVVATRAPRELTRLQDGLMPGNYALARDDGRDALVLLISRNADGGWLAQRFGGRVTTFPADALTAVPLAPKLKRGDKVRMPWVGMFMPGKVTKVAGTWIHAKVEGIGQKQPISAAIGQVMPESAMPKTPAP
ncbi:MAG: hypothetical protein RIT45_2298 [Pseudomonadota bacterium]|jgi:hypothetical protein